MGKERKEGDVVLRINCGNLPVPLAPPSPVAMLASC